MRFRPGTSPYSLPYGLWLNHVAAVLVGYANEEASRLLLKPPLLRRQFSPSFGPFRRANCLAFPSLHSAPLRFARSVSTVRYAPPVSHVPKSSSGCCCYAHPQEPLFTNQYLLLFGSTPVRSLPPRPYFESAEIRKANNKRYLRIK